MATAINDIFTTIGVDLGKNVFHIVGMNARGDARPRNQAPLPECRMPGLAAGQNLPHAGRPRQAEVMDLRPAGVEFLDENGGGPGVRLPKRQHGVLIKGDRNIDPTVRLARNSYGSIY
jgi:hypothetical protein